MNKRLLLVLLSLLLLIVPTDAQQKPMKAYMVADAHLDTQWNWDVQATIKSHIWNTMVQNFHLFRQYPDYIFNFEGGVKYAWMKEYYPTQYEELKKWIGLGRWHIAGSSWDANEVIVCSPESWIRNIALGQTFYRQEFGREGTDVFLPDCFGFPYTMPTLARHCGLIGFSSQKLMWRTVPFHEDGKRYPFTVGLWRGIDGSQIMMTHGFSYGQRYDNEDLSNSEHLKREIGESPLGIAYRYYGTGDIGGSPTIGSVRSVEKGVKGDGPIQIVSATSDQIYKDFLPYEQHPELPTYDGELTMDLHGNGCYTSQAAMKLYNRQNEHLGDAAERTAVMADWLGACSYPIEQMTDTWRRVIWHQFHDDVTGTSIPRAYEFSWNDELLSLKQFADVLNTSVGGVAQQMDTNVGGTPIVVYNNESFPAKGIVKLSWDNAHNYIVTDGKGKKVNSQSCGTDLLFEASVPASGFAVYSIKVGGKRQIPSLKPQNSNIENSVYRITVDANGDISSLYDKRANKELVAEGKHIRLVVFDDCRSEAWPAWEIHKRTLDKAPLPIHENVEVALTEDGPLRKTLCIKKKYGKTDILQCIHLYEGAQADRIDFENVVDWQAENALLKAEFPLSISNEKASYDLGLGKVADDVIGREFPVEFFPGGDGDGEKDFHIVTAVHRSGNGVYVHPLSRLKGISLEGNLIRIDLYAKAGFGGEPLDCIRKASGDKTTRGGINLRVFYPVDGGAFKFRAEIVSDNHTEIFHIRLVPRLFEVLPSLFQNLQAQICGPEGATYTEKVHGFWFRDPLRGNQRGLAGCVEIDVEPVWRRLKVQLDRLIAVLLRCDGNARPQLPDILEIQLLRNAERSAEEAGPRKTRIQGARYPDDALVSEMLQGKVHKRKVNTLHVQARRLTDFAAAPENKGGHILVSGNGVKPSEGLNLSDICKIFTCHSPQR